MASQFPLIKQCGKPSGWLGSVFLSLMGAQHSKLTDWGLSHVAVAPDGVILDIGCGGGRTVGKLAALAPQGRAYGIDYSATSVALSRRTNAARIAAGQVDIQQGSVSQLPFADDTFDLVTAVETHYYWPDLPADLREIRRTLKPGGTLLVIAEMYRQDSDSSRPRGSAADPLTGMRLLALGEHSELLVAAGFAAVRVMDRKGWMCAVGDKAAAAAPP